MQILTLEEHSTKILDFIEEYREDRSLGMIRNSRKTIVKITLSLFPDTQLMIYTYNLCQMRNLDPLLLVPVTIAPNEEEKRFALAKF
jgi:hypothetical protein